MQTNTALQVQVKYSGGWSLTKARAGSRTYCRGGSSLLNSRHRSEPCSCLLDRLTIWLYEHLLVFQLDGEQTPGFEPVHWTVTHAQCPGKFRGSGDPCPTPIANPTGETCLMPTGYITWGHALLFTFSSRARMRSIRYFMRPLCLPVLWGSLLKFPPPNNHLLCGLSSNNYLFPSLFQIYPVGENWGTGRCMLVTNH